MEQAVSAAALMREYTEQYMEKVFYFCLRMCGNVPDAEDLTAEVSEAVVAALQKGVVPARFSAWVWKIARNRCASWLEKRRKRECGAELTPDLPSEEGSAEEALIDGEARRLLRRELAFIAREYREIIVAFYIEDRKTDDIAKVLGLPKGTVTARLCRARQKLKEGMEMAREFGKRSYKPENVFFIMNGQIGKHGEPWSIVDRLLCKNILLAAYNAPRTPEELAIELGVALPYMEDELKKLKDKTLLKEQKGRYATDILIISAETQEKIYEYQRRIAPAFAEKLMEICDCEAKCFAENGTVWHEGYQPYEDLQWARLMRWVDDIEKDVPPLGRPGGRKLADNGYTVRPNGGAWELLGLEDYRGDEPPFVGKHGCYEKPEHQEETVAFWQYRFYKFGLEQKTPTYLTIEEAKALKDTTVAAENHTMPQAPAACLAKLVEHGYLVRDGDTYRPTLWVWFRKKIGDFTEAQKKTLESLRAEAVAIAREHYEFCRKLVQGDVPAHLKDDVHQLDNACETLFLRRGAVLEEALAKGYLSLPQNDEGRMRMLGAYLEI